MDYEVLIGVDGFEAAREAWMRLEPLCDHSVFQNWDVADAWLRTIGSVVHARPVIVLGSERGVPVGLFPGCVTRQGPVPILTWMGDPMVLDYGDILFDPQVEASAQQFVERALSLARTAARGSVLCLPCVRDDATAFPGLRQQLRGYRHGVSPHVVFDGSPLCTGRRSKNLNRLERRLSEHGEVGFGVVEAGDPLAEAVVAGLLGFRSHYAEKGHGTPLDAAYGEFCRTQVEPGASGKAFGLTLDGELIAGALTAEHGGWLYGIITAYDPDRSDLSAGRLLTSRMLQYCSDSPSLQVCDLGWGADEYKYDWARHESQLTTFVSRSVVGWGIEHAAAWRLTRMERSDPHEAARRKPRLAGSGESATA